MNQYNHRQVNAPIDIFWLFVGTLVLTVMVIGGEVLWQKHVRNKQEHINRARLRKIRRNDMRIIQVAQEGQNDFS